MNKDTIMTPNNFAPQVVFTSTEAIKFLSKASFAPANAVDITGAAKLETQTFEATWLLGSIIGAYIC